MNISIVNFKLRLVNNIVNLNVLDFLFKHINWLKQIYALFWFPPQISINIRNHHII